MFVSEELKFVFIPVTKSGSSSVINALDNNFNGRRLQRNPRPPEQFRNYYLFCCVRNPYARMVSWWWTICKAEGDRYGHKRELRQHNLSESLFDFLTLWEIKGTYTQSSYMDRNPTMKKVLKLDRFGAGYITRPTYQGPRKAFQSVTCHPQDGAQLPLQPRRLGRVLSRSDPLFAGGAQVRDPALR